MATITIYPTSSYMRNTVGAGKWRSWSAGTDGIDWVGIGGASSANNYYAWMNFPTGSSFLDPAKYTISSATIQCYQNYYRGSAYTDRIVTAFGKLTPSGTNGLTNIQSTVYMSPKNTDGIWLDAVSCTAGARALQSGTATGVHFMMEKQPNNVRYSELAAYTETSYRSRIVVNYSNRTYTLTVYTGSAGNTTGGGTYAWGTSRTITCTPFAGYRFVRWEFTGLSVSSSTSSTYTFTMPTNNVTANPIYEKITYTISYNGNAQGGGTVSNVPADQTKEYGWTVAISSQIPIHSDVGAIPWTLTCDSNGGSADNETLAVSRTTKYTFSHWNMAADGSSSQDYAPGQTTSRNMNFTLYAQWTSNVVVSSVTLPSSAGTRTGHTFIGWSTSSTATTAAYNPGASYTPTGSRTLYAVWERNQYTVSTSVTPSGSGSVSGSGTYSYQDTCTLTATANSGYSFLEWLQDGETATNGQDNPISFSVLNNTDYTAVFERTLISANYVNNYGVSKYSITGPSTYTVGKDSSKNRYINLDLTIIPSDGYMITALEYCELSDTGATEEWKVLTSGYKWYRANGETYSVTPQIKLSGSDTSIVKIRGIGYWFPRLRIGSQCYAIYTADGTPLIALYYDSQKGKWVPGE